MFEVDRFIADCRTAMEGTDSMKAVREVVQEAVSEPGNIIRALGEPTKGGVQKIHHSDSLTIINVLPDYPDVSAMLPRSPDISCFVG